MSSDVHWSVLPLREGMRQMELYINNGWTESYENAHITEAVVPHVRLFTCASELVGIFEGACGY